MKKNLMTHYRALRSLVALMTIGMMFLPTTAFAQESTTTTTTMAEAPAPAALPAVTELPLLGSNIVIELATDDNGVLASVTVDGQVADFQLEQDDDEIKIEFNVSNANGEFTVEVKFEDGDMKVEVEAQGPTAPGDYVWTGQTCDGGEFTVAYTVTADGMLVLGATTGDVTRTKAEGDEIEVRFADGTKVQFEMDDDGLSIEQKCSDDDHDDDHQSGDDESDDNDSDEDSDDHDSDDHDSDDDDHDDDHDSDDDDDDDSDDDHDSDDDDEDDDEDDK